MKIIYLHQYFNTPSMNGGTRSYEMARRLVSAGHEVHIITTWRKPSEKKKWKYEKIDGIHVHWFPVLYNNKMTYLRRIFAFIYFVIKSKKKGLDIGGEIVFASSTPLTIAIPAIQISKKLKIPMVFEVRDLWPELPIAIKAIKNPIIIFIARVLENFAYKNSSNIIALSPGMKEGILKSGYPENNISIIPNSADLKLFKDDKEKANIFLRSRPELLGDSPIILYAGTLGVINGVSYLVDLAKEAKIKNISANFVVIGQGYEWEKVRNKAIQSGVYESNFFMYSALPKEELVGAFSAATISTSLFIDLKEMESNSANKFFDSLAASKPIFINYGGWHKKLIEENQAGICLSRNINIAIDQINKFLSNSELIQSYSSNSRMLAENEFSRDDLAEKLQNVLINALSNN